MESKSEYTAGVAKPIPAKLNLGIAALQLVLLVSMFFIAGLVAFWPWVPILAIGYALTMNSAYLMLHEAEHGLLHPNYRLNDFVGSVLALFFPAPFHLLRQGHLGHHVRNRTDDEAFDHYFEGDSRLWKHWVFYNILVGGFWFCITLSNIVLPFRPRLWSAKATSFDRPTEALLESLNPRYDSIIRLEAALLILLHAGLILSGIIPWLHWLALIGAFGISWSSMQYMHHYETPRDVLKGARNLRTWGWLDLIWLNHNWHRRHHEKPNVPWIYLPQLDDGPGANREAMSQAWLRQWNGPKPAERTLTNTHAGKHIR